MQPDENKFMEIIKSYENGRSSQITEILRASDVMGEKIKGIEKNLCEFQAMVTSRLDAQDKVMGSLLEKFDNRYAPKIFATAMTVILSTILMAFLGALILMVWPGTAHAIGYMILNKTI